MIIFLRQSNIDPSATGASSLTLRDCCYIQVDYAEVFHDRVEFFPKNGIQHALILKTNDHNWIESMTGIAYDFLFIEEFEDYMPRHLEVLYPCSLTESA